MKLASYLKDGKEAWGVVLDSGVVTMSGRLPYPTLKAALAAGALDAVRKAAAGATPDEKLAGLRFLPVIPNPTKFLAAGINYRSHASETGRDVPKRPSLFARFTDTLLPHEGEMLRPAVSNNFDYEGELAVVIGRPARHVTEAEALDYVAGYTCFVDGSVRDYQKDSVTAGKNFPATGPLGPWLVTSDEIPDPTKLTLMTRLNGQEVQRSGTDLLIYSIPTIISYVSDWTPLSPGDVIATGTPEGVGHRRTPPLWMKPGDVLEVEITGIGTLRARIGQEAA
jgi:2-keto-4-pentenoate hydratase/2-oxohepta-3-ene-1,7-dioic acid hydratase in catechol pathway